jgi:hypothetical protein
MLNQSFIAVGRWGGIPKSLPISKRSEVFALASQGQQVRRAGGRSATSK